MQRMTAILVAALVVTSGCYAGRTASKKRVAYVVNGGAATLGAALVYSSYQSASTSGCDGCYDLGGGLVNFAGYYLGANMLVAAVAMTIVTMAVNVEPEPVRVPTTAQRPATNGVVTTPGLAPTDLAAR